jgi:hypothetical protein
MDFMVIAICTGITGQLRKDLLIKPRFGWPVAMGCYKQAVEKSRRFSPDTM